ncbi:retrovirus-related Pol polyprotein from transposon 17.6 [Trichonephila clavipes]|nr:retrovirus-related Pol polyprotein from transposon 17.6 [Trichonephila clavipes]
MLKEGTIISIRSPYASTVVLCRKNNGLPPDNPETYRFALDYRKLITITKYPRYPLPLIKDLITNIPLTAIMSSLDLRSDYFQLAVNPSEVVKTAFVMKNGEFQWYARFIKNYSDLCESLYNLKKKFKKFCWSIETQKAFDAVKMAITEVPVLKLPDFKKIIRVIY